MTLVNFFKLIMLNIHSQQITLQVYLPNKQYQKKGKLIKIFKITFTVGNLQTGRVNHFKYKHLFGNYL